MGEVDGIERVRSPGHKKSERVGPSYTDDKDVCSKGKQSREENGEKRHPPERQGNTGSCRTPEDSRRRQGHTSTRDEIKYSRQKRKGPNGSLYHHKENGNLAKKMKGSSYPSREPGKEKPTPTTAAHHRRGGSVQRIPRHGDRRRQPRSPLRTPCRQRSKHIPEACQSSLQPRRQYLPEAQRPPHLSPLSRLSTHMDALVEAVGELQAPGGAYLPVPTRGMEPTASQRAWLTWQLAHAGAALYGALSKVESMVAAQPWPPGMSEEADHFSQGPVCHPRDNQIPP